MLCPAIKPSSLSVPYQNSVGDSWKPNVDVSQKGPFSLTGSRGVVMFSPIQAAGGALAVCETAIRCSYCSRTAGVSKFASTPCSGAMMSLHSSTASPTVIGARTLGFNGKDMQRPERHSSSTNATPMAVPFLIQQGFTTGRLHPKIGFPPACGTEAACCSNGPIFAAQLATFSAAQKMSMSAFP